MAALTACIAGITPAVSAQAHGTISPSVEVSSPSLQGHPVMESAIRDGKIVAQQEFILGRGEQLRDLPPGLYDVRVEGEGVVTEEKRGVHLFDGKTLGLAFIIRPGKGAHIVEYGTGALPREEVAARLAKLESQVAELSKHPQK
jgi:hypothetical protein